MISLISLIPIMAVEPPRIAIEPNFLMALAMVESGCDPCAVNVEEDAVGLWQITPIYVEDCNRICKKLGLLQQFTLADRTDIERSRLMVRIYLGYWSRYFASKGYAIGPVELAGIHRWGPSWRPAKMDNPIDNARTMRIRELMGHI